MPKALFLGGSSCFLVFITTYNVTLGSFGYFIVFEVLLLMFIVPKAVFLGGSYRLSGVFPSCSLLPAM